MSEPYKWDVAISLRGVDADLAERLKVALAPLEVFVFTDRQREIAGTDLVDTFTETFKRHARLAVILYRAGWGVSDYTHLEELAIKSRGLTARWRTPVLVALDDTPVPVWYPDIYGYLDFERYGFDETVGVIRARAEELGAINRPESPSERAARMERERAAQQAREERVRAPGALEEVADEVHRLFNILAYHADEIRASAPTLCLRTGIDEREPRYGMRSRNTSTDVLFGRGGTIIRQGTTIDGMTLCVLQGSGIWTLPNDVGSEVRGRPVVFARFELRPILTAQGWQWQAIRALDQRGQLARLAEGKMEVLSSETLVERVLRAHLDRLDADEARA